MVNFLVYGFQSIKVDCERKEWFPILFHRDYITTTKSVCRCEILDLQFLVTCYFYRPQRSCVKVIFSEACVKNSVGGGGLLASVHAGIHHPHPLGSHPAGQTPLGRHPPGRHPWADTRPQQMSTAADGTHRTWMHSCYLIYFQRCVSFKQQTCALKWCTVNAIGWVALIVKTVLHYNAWIWYGHRDSSGRHQEVPIFCQQF